CSALAAVVFLVLSVLDARLKQQSGLGVGDLPSFGSAHLLRQAFAHWWRPLFALSAGFGLGLGYLFLPLYGAAFYLSGIIAREAYAPRPGLLRRVLDMLALVPLAGAACDAASRALYFWMMTNGTSDSLAALAAEAGTAANIAFIIGLALFIAAFVSLLAKRKPSARGN
ncbi:MAG TPA: hypothetical protein VIJ72_04660, partial [Rhizomicrobium sp.]